MKPAEIALFNHFREISDDFNFIKPYIKKTKEFVEIPLLDVPKQIIITMCRHNPVK